MEHFIGPDSPWDMQLKMCREILASYKMGSLPMRTKLTELGLLKTDTSFSELRDILLHDEIDRTVMRELQEIAISELSQLKVRTRTDGYFKTQKP